MSEKSLIKLDGTLIKPNGEKEKTKFFNFLNIQEDEYSDITFTEEEARKIHSHLCHLSTGAAAAVPLYCGGEARCPFAQSCPYIKVTHERKKKDSSAPSAVPLGRRCPQEVNLLNEWTRLFIHEYKIDEDSFTDFQMVREMAEIELMLWRLNSNLSKPLNAELVQESTVAVDKEGNALTRREISTFLEAKEKLQNRKSKLIKLMVGDRQEKYKREAALRMKSEEDPSSSAAQLRGKIDKLLKQAKTLDIKVKEASGEIIDAEIVEETLSPEDLIEEEVN